LVVSEASGNADTLNKFTLNMGVFLKEGFIVASVGNRVAKDLAEMKPS
jgi:hypothetical protein